jgi:hypothetical protein
MMGQIIFHWKEKCEMNKLKYSAAHFNQANTLDITALLQENTLHHGDSVNASNESYQGATSKLPNLPEAQNHMGSPLRKRGVH